MKPLKFNKENAIKFANKIYNDEGYMKLCEGLLQDKEDNMRCILGEASLTFTGKIPNDTHTAQERLANKAVVNDGLINDPFGKIFSQFYYGEKMTKSHLKDLVNEGLDVLMNANDDSRGYKARAKACKKAWLENVVPLLK